MKLIKLAMVLICLFMLVGTCQAIVTNWTPTGYGCSTASDGTYSYAKFDIGTHSYTLIKNVTYYFEVIGGGGTGGGYAGGGGAAGGYVNFTYTPSTAESISVFVGKGANASRGFGTWNGWGATPIVGPGQDSAVLLPTINRTALGGGYGGSSGSTGGVNGGNGGSGGGGGLSGIAGSGTPGQGRNGAAGVANAGGGGGGNQTAGSVGSDPNGGNAGKGTRSLISGENVSCGGGAGTNNVGTTPGYGGCWPDSLTAGNGSSTGDGHAGITPGSAGGGALGGPTGGFYSGSGANGTVMLRYALPAPVASFNATPTTGANPLTVSFNDTTTSASPITSYNVSFGDGSWWNETTFPATNITHLYSTSGNYTVNWYVSNAQGTGSASTTITVWGAVHSAFSLFNSAGTAPHTTYLYDTSTNLTPGPVTYLTTMGDGNSSTAAAFYYTWNGTGTYTVNHSVSNGLSTSYSETNVTVGTPTPAVIAPVASFYGSPTTGNVPLTTSFTDVSSNTPTSWFWDFGDGTNSTLQNPDHTYTKSGFKTVALTATNSAGSNVTTRVKFVRVN